MLEYFTAAMSAQYDFSHEETDTGGMKYPRKVTLRAHHPETGEQHGELSYYPPKRRGAPVTVAAQGFGTLDRERRRGAGSALLDEMERRHPGSRVVWMDKLHEKSKPKPGDPNFNANRDYGLPTDWDTHFPKLPGSIHRGIGISLDSGEAGQINTADRPAHEQAKLLYKHVQDKGSIGMHWSADPVKPHQFAFRNALDPRTDIPVVLHAATPDRRHIETRPDVLRNKGVWPHEHGSGDAEVPVRKRKPVMLTGISWLPDVEHPEADETGWVHHTFDEPMQHYASVEGDDHAAVLPDRTAGRGKPRRRAVPDADRPAPQGGEAGGGPQQGRADAGPVGAGQGGPRPVALHPGAHKDLKALDKPVQKQIGQVIDSIAAGEEGLQTHALTGPLKGWFATKASRGHRVVHQVNDEGHLHVGYVGLHDYDKAIRRLTHYHAARLEDLAPHQRALTEAQEAVRLHHPNLTMPLPTDVEERDAVLRRVLKEHGHPGHEDAFVQVHNGTRGSSNTAIDRHTGAVGVSLHPSKADYGTLLHETAHLLHDHATGRTFGQQAPDEHVHGIGYAQQYAKLLGPWGNKTPGGNYKSGPGDLLLNTYYESLARRTGSRRCPCGIPVVHDPIDGWQHADGSVSHDGEHYGKSVSDLMKRAAHPRPQSRIFGPTYGLDHRLFTGDQLKPEVRTAVMARLGPVIEPLLGHDWQRYTKVYLAGSEASEWTSETLEGNGDFDTLIGIDYDHLGGEPGIPVAGLDDDAINDMLNTALRVSYNASPWKAPFGGEWDLTGYVNADSYDIRKIKPYAAYNITDDTWAVRPPHLPDWSLESFPEGGDNLVNEAEGYAAVVDAISKMPEPFQTQQGRALWKHLHSDRGRAFSDEGEGWLDPGNALEKILVEWGVWDRLVEWQYGRKTASGEVRFTKGRMRLEDITAPGQGLLSPRGYTQRQLATDVKRNGITEPLAVETYRHPETGEWAHFSINGMHRLDAGRKAGVADAPVVVKHPAHITPPLIDAQEATREEHDAAYDSERSGKWASRTASYADFDRECIRTWGASRTASFEEMPVEHVRVDKLWPHREWDHQPGGYSYERDGGGPYAWKHDRESWERNKASVAEGGIQHPITLEYNPRQHRAYIGEGNHRLHWARELGHETVPVRVHRTYHDMHERYAVPGQHSLPEGEHIPEMIRPSLVLPEDWFPGREKTAGARGGLPDLTFKHLPPEDNHSYGGADQDTHTLHAYTADGQHAGELSWFGEDGMIRDVSVHDALRRRGVASELLRRARQIQPEVHHSDALTPDGAGWAGRTSARERLAVKRSDHPLAPDLPEEQHDALDAEDWTEHKRKMLDLARNPVPGTHIWRGELRAKDPVKSARETGVGIHWGVNPDTILRPQAHDGEHEVVYHAEIEHPDEQSFPRSHPMWHGRHMSMDSEAEVRLKPGTKVKLHGVWYSDPYVSDRGYFTPTKPERMGKQWSYHPIGEHVEVAHRPTTDLIDYSDVGVKHEGRRTAAVPGMEFKTTKGRRKGIGHTTISAHVGDSKVGHVRMISGETEVDDLHVVPAMRGRGVARALMNEAIDRFGHQTLRLHASPFGKGGMDAETLRGFYASHGFEPEESRGRGYMIRQPGPMKTEARWSQRDLSHHNGRITAESQLDRDLEDPFHDEAEMPGDIGIAHDEHRDEAWHALQGLDRNDLKGVHRTIEKHAKMPLYIATSRPEKILEHGRMKTLAEMGEQTGKSDGYIDYRHEYERHVMGIEHDAPKHERPIYGVASDHADPGMNYGEFHLEMKPHVRARTTMTGGDSLNHLLHPYSLEHLADHAMRREPERLHGLLSPPMARALGAGLPKPDYFEVQVHGGVDLDDIARIHVHGKPTERKADLIAQARKAGIETVHHPYVSHEDEWMHVKPDFLDQEMHDRQKELSEMTQRRGSKEIRLKLGEESYALYRPGMTHNDKISVVGPSGVREMTWGALVAHSNGEVLEQLPDEDESEPRKEAMLGYFTASDDDYRMQHRPPDIDFGAPHHDIGDDVMPDLYSHPEHYDHSKESSYWDSFRHVVRTRGKPEAKVKIYRALPAEHAHQGFRPGDWVTTSKEYARQHGRESDPKHDWPVISTTVPAKHLQTDGNDLREWGYTGPHKDMPTVSFKGGYHQEIRHDPQGFIKVVKRRGKTADYRLQHRAPDEDSGKPLHHFEGGDPDDLVRIYRAAPHDVDYFDNDTWATTDPDYAHQHAEQYDGSKKWPVMSAEVPKKHVFWDENDPNEVGYQGPRLESHEIEEHDQETGAHVPFEGPSDDERKEMDRGGHHYHGTSLHLPPEDHAFVHDSSNPIAERAHRVFKHLPEKLRENRGGPWEEDPDDAEMDAMPVTKDFEPDQQRRDEHGTPLTQVVLHGSHNLEHAHGISWADASKEPTFFKTDYAHHEFAGDPNRRISKGSMAGYFQVAS